MRILGIETSCDETSAAVVEDGIRVLSCVISSSKGDFADLGGVIPEDAARKQLESILPVIDLALTKSGSTPESIHAIGVTYGPGLLGSLLVGTTTARTLASTWNKPLLGVHHTLGHLSSIWLDCKQDNQPTFPIMTLSVSGGHTDLWHRTSHVSGSLISTTLDDAAGEAFDKGAVLLGLGYPGGPALAALAEDGDEKKFPFPLPLHRDGLLDFSFSGLKTSLKYLIRDLGASAHDTKVRRDLAASFQYAICRHLCDRIILAQQRHPNVKEMHLVGGVSANARLRAMLPQVLSAKDISVRWPATLKYCTDNAAMIASAAFFEHKASGEMLGFPKTLATIPLSTVFSGYASTGRH